MNNRSVVVLSAAVAALLLFAPGCSREPDFDVVLRNGLIYDGSGGAPYRGDVAIRGDRIMAVGQVSGRGRNEVDAGGLAVAPGFINMLSWATESLIQDGRSLADIKQGVTLEVFGEGWSMGPLNDKMKKEAVEQQSDIKYDIQWTTLGQYLEFLEKKGISPNIASFIGATTVRIHELGHEDRAPSAEELQRMRDLVRVAMRDGALGVGTSLIYPPAFYAKTDELIELCKVAAEYDGMYISHMRSEGARLLEALDELITISREAGLPAEVYHLKAGGKSNWPKMDQAIARIEAARKQGLKITADMYTYIAGATGLSATMPPWVEEGGHKEFIKRLKDPAIRRRLVREMSTPTDKWENMFLNAGTDGILLVGFKNDALKPLIGKTLAAVAKERGRSPQETAMDLIIEDDSRVETVYFMMSEDNVQKQIKLPWVAFGSDAGSEAPEGVFLNYNPHPRAYGNFARLLGKYVRDEKLVPLEEAIRRLTLYPAENLKIKERGMVKAGNFADIAVFDAAKIQDHATFEKPHQLATGMVHVFVNGVQVLRDGNHTGATPGRVIRGPGYGKP
ncbi:MAG: N-acyl-D-amino-acid deacylase family protein [Candidatus Acidiferrales bacterium]